MRGECVAGHALALDQPTLARLMIWLSPAYPVGGYSYSHGLEWIVEAGKVTDAATLGGWIEDVLAHGAGRCDVIFLAEAWRAPAAGDMARSSRRPSWRRRSPLRRAAAWRRWRRARRSSPPRWRPGREPELAALAADGARGRLSDRRRRRAPPRTACRWSRRRRRSRRPSPPTSSRPACA